MLNMHRILFGSKMKRILKIRVITMSCPIFSHHNLNGKVGVTLKMNRSERGSEKESRVDIFGEGIR